MSVRTPRFRTSAVALAVAASLTLAACGGDDEAPEDSPQAEESTAPPEEVFYSPLTGLEVDAPTKNPIVVVKIDNSSSSAPQVGLGGADLVVQELVEGGITRLAVAFDSQIPKIVGPVRSMRATDIGIVKPANAFLVASGGAPQTVGRMADADVKTFTEGATGYYRDGARSAPYNLMMNLGDLVKTLKDGEEPPPYLPFSSADDESDAVDFPAGTPAKGLVARFSGGSSTTWSFAQGTYSSTDTFAAEGDRFEPATVLVLRVRVGDAGYLDPAGNPVPETIFEGKGQAMVFHDGRLVRGTWSKDGLGGALKLETRAGELLLPPGKVWIELVPADGGDVTVTK